MPTHRSDAVNHVVLSLGMPCAVDLGIGLIRSWNERKDGEWTNLIRYKETMSARDVFLSINAARVAVRPLCRIPIRLHERPGMLIRAFDKCEVVSGGDSNLHTEIVSTNQGLVAHLPTMWP